MTELFDTIPVEKQEVPYKKLATKFIFQEDDKLGKEVYCIYGNKGEGKTTLAFSFEGNISVLSFDNKSSIVKRHMFNNDKRIKVYDAIEMLDEDVDNVTSSSKITIDFCHYLLQNIKEKDKPDYIVIDGLEIFSKIAENAMRFNHKLSPTQGIANQNIWKERRMYIKALHNEALLSANKGIIYTTYSEQEEIIEEGVVKSRKNVPKWIDIVMWQTDCVIYVYNKKDTDKMNFYCDVISNKLNNQFKTGTTLKVTK